MSHDVNPKHILVQEKLHEKLKCWTQTPTFSFLCWNCITAQYKSNEKNDADSRLLMDFTSQVHRAIKSSNLLRADRKTIDKNSERGRDSRVYVSGVWETVSSWMRSWLCSPYMWGGQRVKGFGKSRCKTWLEARKLTRGRNWSKSYYGTLLHRWRPDPPSGRYYWCPERKMTKCIIHEIQANCNLWYYMSV